MTAIAIDTLKVAQKLQDAGFSRKQAAGAAEVLADALSERAAKEAVADAISTVAVTLGQRIDTVESRLTARIDGVAAKVDGLAVTVGDLATTVDGHTAQLNDHTALLNGHTAQLSDLTVKVDDLTVKVDDHTVRLGRLEQGQVVLMENQLETNRKLDAVLDLVTRLANKK